MTVSHESTIKLLTKLGAGHDDILKGWRDSLTTYLATVITQVCSLKVTNHVAAG